MADVDEEEVGEAASLVRPGASSDVFLLCDHASNRIPPDYGNLGLGSRELRDHVAWDLGAGAVTRTLSKELGASAVLATTSRLVIDCNRQPDRNDLIPAITHSVRVPGNAGLSETAREARFRRHYRPYHASIDRLLRASPASVLITIHSFSHEIDRDRRDFDVGVLYDEYETLARAFAEQLAVAGLRTRLNEPYSGRSEVISSAQVHGRKNGRTHFELEIDQRLLIPDDAAIAFGVRLAPAVAWLGSAARNAMPRPAGG